MAERTRESSVSSRSQPNAHAGEATKALAFEHAQDLPRRGAVQPDNGHGRAIAVGSGGLGGRLACGIEGAEPQRHFQPLLQKI
eukprot:COSAG06_NODE_28266_length_577_cov_1.351464_1_plen_82_part_10